MIYDRSHAARVDFMISIHSRTIETARMMSSHVNFHTSPDVIGTAYACVVQMFVGKKNKGDDVVDGEGNQQQGEAKKVHGEVPCPRPHAHE